MKTPRIKTPQINPVGIVEFPQDYAVSPQRFSRSTRFVAGAFLVFFFVATVVTTVVSVGSYCLTSDGGNTRALHESIEQRRAGDTTRLAAP